MKVLMLGGRRCGKTSVLASMFDQMKNGPVNRYFTVADRTITETKTDVVNGKEITEKQDILSDKVLELKHLLDNRIGNTPFIIDKAPTNFDWKYTLRLQKPGGSSNQSLDIDFWDIPGEWCHEGTKHFDQTLSMVSEGCDIIVVVIDTPYLMEAKDYVNEGANRIDGVHTLLTSIKDVDDAKMVIFVPIKCEKWYKENSLDKVTAKIQEVYNSSIKHLLGEEMKDMTVCIMPILTAGNIIFQELRPAKFIKGPTIPRQKCAELTESLIRLENGKSYQKGIDDIVDDDTDAYITGTPEHPNILRPYEWFIINKESNEFSPYNCEQLPLHILLFLLNKLDAARAKVKTTENKDGIMGSIIRLLRKLSDIIARIVKSFGGLGENNVRQIISQLQTDGLIKENCDGITYLRRGV